MLINLKNEIKESSTDLIILFKQVRRFVFKKFSAEYYLIKDVKNAISCIAITFLSNFFILQDANKPNILAHKLSFLSIFSFLGFVFFFSYGVFRYIGLRYKITSKYKEYRYYKLGEMIETLVIMFLFGLLLISIPIIAFNQALRIFNLF